jgi:hypothetical protein
MGEHRLAIESASFSAGTKVLIHQSRGSGSGGWEINEVQASCPGFVFVANPLARTYRTGSAQAAQVLVVPEYTTMTVDQGITVTAQPWNGTTGGIFAALANASTQLAGSIALSGGGFRGGQAAGGSHNPGYTGEGTGGTSFHTPPDAENGSGGGADSGTVAASGNPGGGGGNGSAGEPGVRGPTQIQGGLTSGSPTLSLATFGGGGGGAESGNEVNGGNAAGGNGGGIAFVFAPIVSVLQTGALQANGAGGQASSVFNGNGAGGGAGGSILIRAVDALVGEMLVTANSGPGGVPTGGGTTGVGGAGGNGRIRIEACTINGTTSPNASTADVAINDDQDIFRKCVEDGCGSDDLDANSRPERIDGAFDNVDDDKDTQTDEVLPPTAIPYDCDGDGYRGSAENHVSSYLPGPPTDGDQKVCQDYDVDFPGQVAHVKPSKGWPSDLASGSFSHNKINVQDLSTFVAPVRYFNSDVGAHPPADVRFDLVPGSGILPDDINITDLAAITAGETGSPPMLGGVRAFNGPMCP